MKFKKALAAFGVMLCAVAMAKTWYVIGKVSGSPEADVGDEYSLAAAAFRMQYTGAAMAKIAPKSDVVDVQYQDGSILEFNLVSNWMYSNITWDPTKAPKVKQGPSRKTPVTLYQPNGNPITAALNRPGFRGGQLV